MEKRVREILTPIETLQALGVQAKDMPDELYLLTCPNCQHREVHKTDPDLIKP